MIFKPKQHLISKISDKSIMQKKYHFILILFSVFSLTNIQLYSQTNTDSIDFFLNSIYKIYGPNDNLISGYPYILPDKRVQGHPYLINNEWFNFSIYINNKSFHNQKAKYNIRKDALILKARIGQKGENLIQLNKHLVDSFKINRRLFVNSSYYPLDKNEVSFYEQIFVSIDIAFIRKFNKNFSEPQNSIHSYGHYSNTEETRYIITDNKIEKVNSRYAFIRFFPKEKRKHIRSFLKKNNIDYNTANLFQLIKLSNYSFNKQDL